MGTEGIWVPLALSALGAAGSAYNTHRTARKQDRAAAAGIRQAGARQQQAAQALNKNIGAMERSDPSADRAEQTAQFMSQLQANRGNARGGGEVRGASDRFRSDTTATDAAIQNFGAQRAGQMASIAAPYLQRQREQVARGRTGADLARLARDTESDDFLMRLRQASIQRDPWIDFASGLAKAGGSAMAGKGGKQYGLGEDMDLPDVDIGVPGGPIEAPRIPRIEVFG